MPLTAEDKARERTERLRQAILKKAFAGKLPASAERVLQLNNAE